MKDSFNLKILIELDAFGKTFAQGSIFIFAQKN